jgi:Raf kinase inhibitor-like YbhB/YbcL family protein
MRRSVLTLAVAATALSACATDDGRTLKPPVFPPPQTVAPEPTLPPEPAVTELAVTEPLALIAAWPDGAEIPLRHTCSGDDLSPALTWTNVPPDAVELAITVVDLDAGGFVHWILLGIDPQRTSLIENEQPRPGIEWSNSAGTMGWTGPCPPPDGQHIYQFTVHALNQRLEPADDAPATEVISMLNLIAIDQGALTGVFARIE